MNHPEVLIIGAGPVGLTMAHFLGKAGVRTLVLERNSSTVHEPRAVSLDDESLRIFQSLDLMQSLRANVLLDRIEVVYYNGQGSTLFRVNPSEFPYGYPRVGLFFQPDLEKTLLEGLAKFPHVEVKFNQTLKEVFQTSQEVHVNSSDSEGKMHRFYGQYLLGCDGGKSAVRSALQIPFTGSTYKERWLVLDFLGEAAKKDQVSFYCDPRRPAVNMPLPHGYSRWEFLVLPGETDEELLKTEKIHSLLMPYLDPVSLFLIRKTVYTFHARLASQYQKDRCFLVGDAAHLMPPFGGQGLCSGLRDVQNLSWKLAAVVQKKGDPSLLKTYPIERLEHTKAMINLSMRLGSLMTQTGRTQVAFRDVLFYGLQKIPAMKRRFKEMKFKRIPQYSSGFIWKHPLAGKLTGKFLLQPIVKSSDGTQTLLDEVLGNGFSLIGLGIDPVVAIQGRAEIMIALLHPIFIQMNPAHELIVKGGVQDVNGLFKYEFMSGNPRLLLVRPDRFILAHFDPENCEDLSEYLKKTL